MSLAVGDADDDGDDRLPDVRGAHPKYWLDVGGGVAHRIIIATVATVATVTAVVILVLLHQRARGGLAGTDTPTRPEATGS